MPYFIGIFKKYEKICLTSYLPKIYNHLNDNGILLLTLRDENVGNMKYRNDFCGKEMYWSYYSYDKYIKLLNEIGFKVLYAVNQNKFGISESHNLVILI